MVGRPGDNDGIDAYFASLNAAGNSGKSNSKQGDEVPSANGSQLPNDETWLDAESRSRLETDIEITSFILQWINNPNSCPNPDELANNINQKFEKLNPSQLPHNSNPNSESFVEVRAKVEKAINGIEGAKIFYQTDSSEGLDSSKKIAIIILDHGHTSAADALKKFKTLKALHIDSDLQLSSSFLEGDVNPISFLNSPNAPQEMPLAKIEDLVTRGKIAAEHGVLYEAKNNGKELTMNPENISQAEKMDLMLMKLIPIASGDVPNSAEVLRGIGFELDKLLHTKIAYEKQGLKNNFYALLASRMKTFFDALDMPQDSQRALATNAVELISSYEESTKKKNPQIFITRLLQTKQVLQPSDLQKLAQHIQTQTHQKTIVERNHKIADAFANAPEGTRTIAIGSAHVDYQRAGDDGLITLLEDGKKIPMIVIA